MKTLLPEKFRNKYNKTYVGILHWKTEKNAYSVSENVSLSYFSEKAHKYLVVFVFYVKNYYILSKRHNVMECKQIIEFLKRKSEEIQNNKSKALTRNTTDVLHTFLENNPDYKYLR